MTIDSVLKGAWDKTKTNLKEKRYFHNYINDVLAGVLSRTPAYVAIDSLIIGVPDANVLDSAFKTLKVCTFGWSLVYTLGQSVMTESLGDFYNKNKKKIDALYSFTLTFGFGMYVNLAAGYSIKQALFASGFRAGIALFLGTPTQYYIDAFRDTRGEPVTVQHTNFNDKSWSYKIPRLAAMIGIPLAIMAGSVALSPDKNGTKDAKPQIEQTMQQPSQYLLNK